MVDDDLYVFVVLEEYDFYRLSHPTMCSPVLYFCVFYTRMSDLSLIPKTIYTTDAYSMSMVVMSVSAGMHDQPFSPVDFLACFQRSQLTESQ